MLGTISLTIHSIAIITLSLRKIKMKLFFFILTTLLYISLVSMYSVLKLQAKVFLTSLVSPRYSTANHNVITVLYPPHHGFTYSTDDPILVENKYFSYFPQIFSLDDTSLLVELNLACKPITYGYSFEEGNIKFPPYTYPKCSAVNKQDDSFIHIDRKNEKLYMDCPGSSGSFIKGPIDNNRLIQYPEGILWTRENYYSPINSSKLEYALGSCGALDYQQGTMMPIFNQTLFNISKSKVTEKPKILFFLTLDSLSRRHFFRKLPSVIDLLNNFHNVYPNFTVHDFKLHNILGEDSIGNQGPIFAGKKKFTRNSGNRNIDYYGESALWNILRKKGFISLLGFDDCDFNFPRSMGQNPKADYKVRQFYCAVQHLSHISSEEWYKKQRCLGGHLIHYYLLNYTMNLVRMYEGTNIWIYLHLNAAHDGNGQHAATLNDDIKEFLEGFLNEFQQNSDIAIFMQGDHGMRYGEWYDRVEAYQETKLPGLFLITSKSLLEQYPFSYHALSINSQRFTSKLDLRETILSLAGIKEKTPYSNDLVSHSILKSRTCRNTGTEPLLCSCSQMTEIKSFGDKMQSLLNQLRTYSENIVNSLAYSNSAYQLRKFCRKILLDKVKRVYHIDINNVNEIFKVEFGTSIDKKFRLEVDFYIASDRERSDLTNDNFKSQSLIVNGFPSLAKVI